MAEHGPPSWSMHTLQNQVQVSRSAQYSFYRTNNALIMAEYNNVVGGKYKLIRTIGSGTFGIIYLAEDINRPGYQVAVKVESVNHKYPLIPHETSIYQHLQSKHGSEHLYEGRAGIPYHYWTGTQSDYNILVMEKLGPSLESLFAFCNRRFTLKTTLMLADQMISLLEYIHVKNILHRDIKACNFLIGDAVRNSFRVYIIDFGLSKFYRSLSPPYYHLPMRNTGKNMIGTARYASINTHRGISMGRRDDLEALGYVLIYFVQGSLPWQGLQSVNKNQKYEMICEMKMSIPIPFLCAGAPIEFGQYMRYCRSLAYDQEPNYRILKHLFYSVMTNFGFAYDYNFDWLLRGVSFKTLLTLLR